MSEDASNPTSSGLTAADIIAHGKENAISPAEPNERQIRHRQLSAQLRVSKAQQVVFRPALFWHDTEAIIWPSTVNLIQGQTGVHKSRVAELFGSAMLAALADRPNLAATLGVGFRPEPGEQYRLLYVDTERNLSDQLPYALQQLQVRAGYEIAEHPLDFDFTSLVLEPRAERFDALNDFLIDQRRSFNGHLIVILDVLSDCVSDFNDVNASSCLLDLLNVAANKQNTTFLAVIHENPGSIKARGHLGTEASNKASTVLQVSLVKEQNRPTGLIQLLYLKRRLGGLNLTFFATYDEMAKGLVRADADAPEVQVRTRPTTASRSEGPTVTLSRILPELLADGPMQSGLLEEAAAVQLNVSSRAVRTYLKELMQPSNNRVRCTDGSIYELQKIKAMSGPARLYRLVLLPI